MLPVISPDSSEHKNANPRATSRGLVNLLKAVFFSAFSSQSSPPS